MAERDLDLIKSSLVSAGEQTVLDMAYAYRKILSIAYISATKQGVDLDNPENAKLFVKSAISLYPGLLPTLRKEKNWPNKT